MDLELTEQQRLIQQTCRQFTQDQIVPLEAEMDPDAYELPAAEFARLSAMAKEMGFWNLDAPAEVGGPGLDLLTLTVCYEETAQHRSGLYTPTYGTFGMHGAGAGLAQLYDADDYQREHYLYPLLRGEKRGCFALTEPSGGSDPARAIQTKAVRDGDDWLINGSKIFISGAAVADFAVVFTRTDAAKGREGVTCFIVDTASPGFEVRRIVHTLRSSEPATELSFDDVRVPNRNILGEIGGGFTLANQRLTRNRVTYASACTGVAVAAHQMAVAYAKQRETFGAPLSSRQAIQWMLVDNEIDIRTARWLTYDAADKADRGKPYRFEAAMAKLVASEGGGRVVDRCIQVHGGYGVTKDLPLERWYREMRIRRIGEGPSEVQRHIMARDILGDR
jgi:alkylation response protein AidB-like acyl-CoA dehydrogenase